MLPEVLRDAEVADDVLALRPDYRALLLVVEDISPGPGDDASEALLLRAESTAIALTAGAPVEGNYNAANQLTSVGGATTLTNTYDADGVDR